MNAQRALPGLQRSHCNTEEYSPDSTELTEAYRGSKGPLSLITKIEKSSPGLTVGQSTQIVALFSFSTTSKPQQVLLKRCCKFAFESNHRNILHILLSRVIWNPYGLLNNYYWYKLYMLANVDIDAILILIPRSVIHEQYIFWNQTIDNRFFG